MNISWNIGNFLENSLEGLTLKLQYFDHLMGRADSLEKTLMLGKIEGRKRRGQQRVKWLDSVTDSVDMNLSKLQEIVRVRGAWLAAVNLAIEQQQGVMGGKGITKRNFTLE